MLPDMSDVLVDWEIDVLLKTITERTIDQVRSDIVQVAPLRAVVQPAQKKSINPDLLDWSREYLQIHSRSPLALGQVIEFQGRDYKIVDLGNYQLYGFTEVVAESTNRPPLQATP